ncbi:hypothetical protein [Actinoplanes derwentensis]|uniref:Uncharacterized protein n=1 Tax=Actinoplanes derwentensis TaxID=113562 RepID=A0A1H1YYE1_9ACTN|nr:hypothetical protein [Actinoplanes derwentensis]GID81327.1 hypothetical protein Ade03nite_02510 [Actinoplanes derwentensis]SDT25946.1 hypothetical protein SAMN04489716_3034 [Actinoplanes derwentensis]
MIDALGEAVAGHVVERLLTRLGAALVFAVGGALAWLSAHGGWGRLVAVGEQVAGLPTLVVMALVAALLAVAFAGTTLVRLLTRPVLRFLEGYWTWPLQPLRVWLVKRERSRRTALEKELRTVALRGERSRQGRPEQLLHRIPADPWLMPTRLGNMLRAAETRPHGKYGLDAVALWPHLWLVLPEQARLDLGAARAALDRAVATAIWALAFLPFGFWSPWALVAGLVPVVFVVRLWIPHRAARYADMLEAAYDMYRRRLYEQVRWPLPTDPDDERVQGERLTTYLVRGLVGSAPVFEERAS